MSFAVLFSGTKHDSELPTASQTQRCNVVTVPYESRI